MPVRPGHVHKASKTASPRHSLASLVRGMCGRHGGVDGLTDWGRVGCIVIECPIIAGIISLLRPGFIYNPANAPCAGQPTCTQHVRTWVWKFRGWKFRVWNLWGLNPE